MKKLSKKDHFLIYVIIIYMNYYFKEGTGADRYWCSVHFPPPKQKLF